MFPWGPCYMLSSVIYHVPLGALLHALICNLSCSRGAPATRSHVCSSRKIPLHILTSVLYCVPQGVPCYTLSSVLHFVPPPLLPTHQCTLWCCDRGPLLHALISVFELPEDDTVPDDEHFIEIEDTPGL